MGGMAVLPYGAPEADVAMKDTTYRWNADGRVRVFEMAPVRGTRGVPYDFGEADALRPVNVHDFAIGRYPVTGALWEHIMGAETNTSARGGTNLPLENVSGMTSRARMASLSA